MDKIYDLAEEYANSIIESDDFKRYLELKEEIRKTLGMKIVAFKTKEAKYVEAKSYGNYHPDLKKYQEEFHIAKTNLYSHPLMVEYKELEHKIQAKLDEDLNDLKSTISNKFKLEKIF